MAMKDLNVTIRLLDPPLHEFLPQEEDKIAELAKALGLSVEQVKSRIEFLHEFNPMMGHRGVRLDVSYPEIGRMQTRAIIRAALQAQKELNKPVVPEIMIPLVLDVKELKFVKDIIEETANEEIAKSGQTMTYLVGTMIEIPRAALLAEKVAEEATFFSFGTNDLTQMTYGFSRDDAGKFLPDYYKTKIFEQDPFQTVDQHGVGKLIKMAVADGRKTRPNLKVGICGEHGGEPDSIEFFHNAGLDYVSCSPFRVPVARLSAAQAALKASKK
jgi:pyruvate,orthophosphate dikinase